MASLTPASEDLKKLFLRKEVNGTVLSRRRKTTGRNRHSSTMYLSLNPVKLFAMMASYWRRQHGSRKKQYMTVHVSMTQQAIRFGPRNRISKISHWLIWIESSFPILHALQSKSALYGLGNRPNLTKSRGCESTICILFGRDQLG